MSENNSNKEPSIINHNKEADKENNIDSKEGENDYNFLSFDFKSEIKNGNKIPAEPTIENAKTSFDLNEQNLHEFLNYDLINSLNNDLIESNISCSNEDPSIKRNTILDNSGQNSNLNSLDHYIENNDLSKDKSQKEEIKNINKYENKDGVNNNISDIIFNKNVIKEDKNKNIEKNINDKIDYLNIPLMAPMYIPKKIRAKFEEKKESNKQDINNNLKEKDIPYKNKFDEENSETLSNFVLNKNYEKAKMPFEIRIGDWICFFCNNLNFSFRMKCNKCGVLKKSNTLLYGKKFNNNLNNNYNFKDSFNNGNLGQYAANDINNNNNF